MISEKNKDVKRKKLFQCFSLSRFVSDTNFQFGMRQIPDRTDRPNSPDKREYQRQREYPPARSQTRAV